MKFGIDFEINIDTWVGVSACAVAVVWIVCRWYFRGISKDVKDARD